MTNSMNSATDAMRRQPERYRRYLSIAAALCLVIMTVASGGPASAAASEAEARSLFTRFVAAQNAHNIGDVKAMLWNSPSMLWFSRGHADSGPHRFHARPSRQAPTRQHVSDQPDVGSRRKRLVNRFHPADREHPAQIAVWCVPIATGRLRSQRHVTLLRCNRIC